MSKILLRTQEPHRAFGVGSAGTREFDRIFHSAMAADAAADPRSSAVSHYLEQVNLWISTMRILANAKIEMEEIFQSLQDYGFAKVDCPSRVHFDSHSHDIRLVAALEVPAARVSGREFAKKVMVFFELPSTPLVAPHHRTLDEFYPIFRHSANHPEFAPALDRLHQKLTQLSNPDGHAASLLEQIASEMETSWRKAKISLSWLRPDESVTHERAIDSKVALREGAFADLLKIGLILVARTPPPELTNLLEEHCLVVSESSGALPTSLPEHRRLGT